MINNKLFLKLFWIVCLVVLISHLTMAQEDMKFIKSPAFKKHQRPPAVFYHDQHNEKAGIEDCSICHHYYENGKLVEGAMSVGQPCSDCHHLKKYKGNKIPLMDAYHNRCIQCHKQRKKGPLACGECHVKK